MGDRFFGFERITGKAVGVLPPILGSIEAWKVRDGDRRVTLVHARPDIITYHLAGTTYLSNIDHLAADLEQMQRRPTEPGELRMLEVRHVVEARIPLGIFEPVDGWPLRDVTGFIQCGPPLAAALALALAATYTGGPNVVTPDGRLIRQMLPHFSNIWRSEQPSFIGSEPDISEEGRSREAHQVFAKLCGEPAADLVALAKRVEVGPQLAGLLATSYGMRSPW